MVDIGDHVETFNGHKGIVIKVFKATGHGMMVHISEDSGKIYFCRVIDLVSLSRNNHTV